MLSQYNSRRTPTHTVLQFPKPARGMQPNMPQSTPPDSSGLPNDIGSRFGRRIRELRLARGMTQVDVAVYFGIDRTFLSDLERGRKGLCLTTMEIFALGFNMSLSELLRDL